MKLRTNRNTLIAALVFTGLSGISAISHANIPHEGYDTESVSYSTLELKNTQGQQSLYARLRRAAKNVCDQEYNRLERRECEQDALERAIEDVNHPALSAMQRN